MLRWICMFSCSRNLIRFWGKSVANIFCVERTGGGQVVCAANNGARILKDGHLVIAGAKAQQIIIAFDLPREFKFLPQGGKIDPARLRGRDLHRIPATKDCGELLCFSLECFKPSEATSKTFSGASANIEAPPFVAPDVKLHQ